MGCGVSKKSAAAGVLDNTVSQNGDAHPKSAKGGVTDLDLRDPELEEAATRIQAAYRGHASRKGIIKMSNQEEEVIDIDLNDPEVSSAATKIQASFRGHKARKEAEKSKAEAELSEELEKLKTKADDEEELPDLTDPELNKAATKIQAQFKGHMVRKTKKDEPSSEK